MTQLFIQLCLFLLMTTHAWGFDDQSPCFKDFERNFFKYELVSKALSLHEVYPTSWVVIVQLLHERSVGVSDTVRAHARLIQPNPLDYPFNPVVASHLLLQTLFDIFNRTVRQYGVINDADIEEMFDYILTQQQRQWIYCFGKEAWDKRGV